MGMGIGLVRPGRSADVFMACGPTRLFFEPAGG
jgi:hypothetical protein